MTLGNWHRRYIKTYVHHLRNNTKALEHLAILAGLFKSQKLITFTYTKDAEGNGQTAVGRQEFNPLRSQPPSKVDYSKSLVCSIRYIQEGGHLVTADPESDNVTFTDCEEFARRCLAAGSYEEAASHFTLALRGPGSASQQAGCHMGRATCRKQMGLLHLVSVRKLAKSKLLVFFGDWMMVSLI